jgi:predicted RNA-binding protein with PUA-like domain
MAHWILKTEPNCYSFENLEKDKVTCWDGVRNFQARNNLQTMKIGDTCLIYHSVGPKEIVGVAKVVKEAYVDPTSKDSRFVAVDLTPVSRLKTPVSLALMKEQAALAKLSLIKQSRLSVCPITESEWKCIIQLGA